MSLASYRLLTVNEFDKDDKLAVRTAKAMTGNDVMKARDLYSKYKDIQINGKILISTNEMPKLSEDTSEALWDRLRILPFKLRVNDAKENTNLLDDLKKELPGILNFALEGLKLYRQNRLLLREETPVMFEAKSNYRITIKSNVIREFINLNYERCDPKSGKTKSIEIIDSFHQWARDNRIAISLTAQRLKKEMHELGIPENATGGRYYCCVPRNNIEIETETEIKTETELLNGEVN
jgi:putative DNA primase/helicase